ncbi:hypothetical protein K1X84_14825 [bacterium]|nr:hypothetical protein [bacterium]
MKKSYFDSAKKYLLSFDGVTENILDSQIVFDESQIPKTKSDLFFKMISHACNRQGMPNSIGDIKAISQFLYNFDSDATAENYNSWDDLFERIKGHYKPPGRMVKSNPHSHWVIFCKSIISIATFLKRFITIDDFDSFVSSFISHSVADVRLGLPLILEKEIFGYKFALACDFLKENVSPEFVKPDTHIKDIFIGLGISNPDASDFQIFRDVIAYSEEIKTKPYTVDKMFWLVGSGDFYKHKVIIRSNKKEFIAKVKSNAL